jgi:uncharacterized membrane protein
MPLLLTGLLLFAGFHLLTAIAPRRCDQLRERLGEHALKGIVALGVLAGLALIVIGWRGADVTYLYATAPVLRLPALVLIAVGLWFFVVSQRPSRVKAVVRHPQLTGVLLWSIAHLLLNGDSRSVVLFGGLALWSVLEIALINRRDGAYKPPPAPAIGPEITSILVAALVFVVLAWAHPWLAGVPVLPAR